MDEALACPLSKAAATLNYRQTCFLTEQPRSEEARLLI